MSNKPQITIDKDKLYETFILFQNFLQQQQQPSTHPVSSSEKSFDQENIITSLTNKLYPKSKLQQYETLPNQRSQTNNLNSKSNISSRTLNIHSLESNSFELHPDNNFHKSNSHQQLKSSFSNTNINNKDETPTSPDINNNTINALIEEYKLKNAKLDSLITENNKRQIDLINEQDKLNKLKLQYENEYTSLITENTKLKKQITKYKTEINTLKTQLNNNNNNNKHNIINQQPLAKSSRNFKHKLPLLNEIDFINNTKYKMTFPSKYHSPQYIPELLNEETNNRYTIKTFSDNHKEIINVHTNEKEILYDDGYSITYCNNGDIKQTFPNGKVCFYMKSANVLEIDYSNGMKVYQYANGQVEKFYPNGRKILLYEDGSIKYVDIDGSEEIIKK